MKTAIIYYSRGGNTKHAAELLHNKLKEKKQDADLIEVQTVKKLGFFGAGRAGMKEKEIPIKNPGFDLKNYDTLIVGAPIWGGKPSPVIKTFMTTAQNTQGKKAATFITSGGETSTRGTAKEIMKSWMEPLGITVGEAFFGLQMSKGKIKNGEEQIDSFIQAVLSH